MLLIITGLGLHAFSSVECKLCRGQRLSDLNSNFRFKANESHGRTAMGLKQANFLSWSPYLNECVHVLQSSPEAMSSDRLLSLAAKLQRIKDDVVVRFETENKYLISRSHHSDSSSEITSFRKRIEDWSNEKPQQLDSCSSIRY